MAAESETATTLGDGGDDATSVGGANLLTGAMALVAADEQLINPHTGESETKDERAERLRLEKEAGFIAYGVLVNLHLHVRADVIEQDCRARHRELVGTIRRGIHAKHGEVLKRCGVHRQYPCRAVISVEQIHIVRPHC